MLALSPKSRAEEGSTRKQKRSRAGTSHPRPNLRAPHLSSCPGLHPYDSHNPSHRAPSSTTQAHFWRASGASRLSARSHEPQVFIKPSKRCNSPTPPQYLPLQQMFETDFRCNPFFRTPNQTPSLFLQSPLQAWAKPPPPPPPYPLLLLPPPLRISVDSLGRTPVLSPVPPCRGDPGLLPSRDARTVQAVHRSRT